MAKQHTYRDFELKLIHNVQCLQANHLYSPCGLHVHFSNNYSCIYMDVNYLRRIRSISWLLLALLDTYLVTNMINRLGIAIKNEGDRQIKNSSNYNVEYRDGTKSNGDKIGMPCTHSTVI